MTVAVAIFASIPEQASSIWIRLSSSIAGSPMSTSNDSIQPLSSSTTKVFNPAGSEVLMLSIML